MKKIYISLMILFAMIVCSCAKSDIQYMTINGEEVDVRFINSGYYLTKASLSDALLADAIDKVFEIEKPDPLGETKLPDMTSIEIKTASISEVTDAMVEANIEQKRDRAIVYETIKDKRPAKIGDKVVVDFDGKIDGESFEGGTASQETITLGSGQYIEALEQGIVGHRAGDVFDVKVTFPMANDYMEPDVKAVYDRIGGKTAVFNVRINYIQEPVTPALDYNFITERSKTGATTSEAYRAEIRDILEYKKWYNSVKDIQDKIIAYVLENTECTPSELGLAWRFSKILMTQKRLSEYQGKTLFADLKSQAESQGATVNQMLEGYRFQSAYVIIEDMVYDALAKLYNVKMEDGDMEAWYNVIAKVNEYGSDVDYNFYKNSMGDSYVYDNARNYKILSEAMKHVKVIYTTENDTNENGG